MEGYTEFIIAIGTLVTALVTGGIKLYTLNKENLNLKYHKENNDIKISIYEDILSIKSISKISNAVSEIFARTIADRFLIIIGLEIDGVVNHISVIFEQHNYKDKQVKVNAIARYSNLKIDEGYRKVLEHIKTFGGVDIEVGSMRKSLLRDVYDSEDVKFSRLKYLNSKEIKKGKELICFSSIATHENRIFNDKENIEIKIMYDSVIIPIINSLLEGGYKENSDGSLEPR